MREAMASTTIDLLERDAWVAIVLADISGEYFERALERETRRVVNVGIMEQTMVGVAAGFAMEGFHPIMHSIAPFLTERPLEQLKVDFGYQGLGGTLVSVGASYDYASEGGTHQAPGDVQVLLSIPGMEVLLPGHPDEVDALLRATYANGRPTYIRLSTASNDDAFDVAPGRLEVVRRGSVGTVLALGPMLSRTLEGAAGLDVSVVYATSVSPFDAGTLVAVADDRRLVVVVEPFYEGTSVSVVSDAFRGTASTIVPIGVPRRFLRNFGTAAEHDAALGLDAPGIRRRLLEALAVP
jgi:transketolase